MKKITIWLIIINLLCGCQDKKNLIDILFPSSMAIDYQDGKYIIGLEIDNLNTISKTELESSTDTNQVLVATGEGNSIEEALKNIEENQRSEIDLSHVRSLILLSGTLNKETLMDICSYATFNPHLRMDTGVYYSEDDIKKIYSINFQIGRSQFYVLINSPEFKKVSIILQSMNIMQLAKAINDQNITINLPILNVNDYKDAYESSDGEKQQKIYDVKELLYLDTNQNCYKKIPFENLKGIQWINHHNIEVDVNIEVNSHAIHAYSSEVNTYIIFNPITDTYHLKGKISLVLTRDLLLRPLDELKPYLEQEIHNQIAHTYQIGLENGLDIYNIRYKSMLFGKNVKLTQNNFIDEVDIELEIRGSYISQT